MWLLPGTRERLIERYCSDVRTLPEERAARLVSRLAEKDGQWSEVIVAATADDRPLVASAAESELRSLVVRWATLPAAESSPRVAALSRALNETAASLPPDRRSFARSLAHQLIVWPVDGSVIDVAQFIADCEAILLLPVVEPVEIRVASTPPPVRPEPTAPQEGPVLPPTELPPEQPPPVLISETIPPPAPAPKSPSEPERFVPDRSLRITDQ
jgi:hypothetical protein